MTARKKTISAASSSQKKTQQYSTEKARTIKKRRHDLYRQLSPDKKESLLLQRRTRRLQSKNQNFFTNSPVPLPNSQPRLTEQRGVTINEISPDTETATTFEVPGKGKEIVACFSTFEIGSTSATRTEHDAFGATITITEMPHQAKTDDTSQLMSGKANNLVGCFSTFQVGLSNITSK